MTSTFDVVIVGAGPAGSTTAALFAAQGRKVLLVDAMRFPRAKACAEYISPGGVAVLDRLGALGRLERAGRGRWLHGMEIQSPGGARHLVEYQSAAGTRRCGLSVRRTDLDATVLECAHASGAEVREGFRVRDVWREHSKVCGVIGSSGEQIRAGLTVGADGLHSVVARGAAGRARVAWPRRLGLVAHYEGVPWLEDYGRMVVGKRSYVGIAPLDHRGTVTVGLVRPMPRARMGSPAAALEAGLDEFPDHAKRLRQGRRDPAVIGVGPLASRVRRVAGPGYALVGDAAGFFDPFTGEGIFRALRGAELLASDPQTYAMRRRQTFRPKERLVALVQLFVQTPALMNFALHRLQTRPAAARALGCVLGDVAPARLDIVWRLLGP